MFYGNIFPENRSDFFAFKRMYDIRDEKLNGIILRKEGNEFLVSFVWLTDKNRKNWNSSDVFINCMLSCPCDPLPKLLVVGQFFYVILIFSVICRPDKIVYNTCLCKLLDMSF